jgi:hypothetical protein
VTPGIDERRVRRRAWSAWGILVAAAVLVLLALPLLLLFDLSNSLNDDDEIPGDVRARLERIEEDAAFRWTPPGAEQVGAGMSAEVCEGSSAVSANVWRRFEFDGSPERFAQRVSDRYTAGGWAARPTSTTVVGFRRGFGPWTGEVLLVVQRSGVANVTGRTDDPLTCGGVD